MPPPAAPEPFDQTLLPQAVAGDPIALQAILAACAPAVLGYVRQNLPVPLRDAYDPADILQDTCVEACRRMRDFEPREGATVLAWLKTIARHRMVYLLRQHNAGKRGGGARRIDAHALADGDGEFAGVTTLLDSLAVYHRTPSISAAANELVIALDAAIASLPEDQRQAVQLRHFEGLPPAEAAARMSRSEQAFHALCARGYKRLRLLMRSRSIYI